MTGPSDSSPAFQGARAAVGLGVALLSAMALVTGFTAFDRSRRSKLETFEQVTAVGDTDYFKATKKELIIGTKLAAFGEQPLYLASRERVEIRDSRTRFSGRDAATGAGIYTTSEPIKLSDDAALTDGAKFFFLKIEPDGYLAMQPVQPAPSP